MSSSFHAPPLLRKVLRGTFYTVPVVVGLPLVASCVKAYVDYRNAPVVSELHTLYSIWIQSLTNLVTQRMGESSHRRLQENCQHAAQVNERLLLELLQQNKDTTYGKDHDFASIENRNDFRRRHPLTHHEDYQRYLERMEKGDTHVLFADDLRMFGVTSGTSGQKSLIPCTSRQRSVFFLDCICILFDTMTKQVWNTHSNLQKSCKLMYTPVYTTTTGGTRVGPNASAPGDNPTLLHLYTTDRDAWQVTNDAHLLFLHVLYALLDRNLGILEANFASGIFNFMECLDQHWEDLVSSVETGTLPKWLDLTDELRQSLESRLLPRPERAQQLRQIREEPQSTNSSTETTQTMPFARQVWPHLHTIMANETGAFQIYGEKLRQEWIGQADKNPHAIPIYSPVYAATEGMMGVNNDYHGQSFILQPTAMFFEFLPIESSFNDDQKDKNDKTTQEETLFMEQLEIGKYYELVITNLAGLCRYRFGDVIQCVGYEGEAPRVKVAYRKGQFLNAVQEQTSEEAFYTALSQTAKLDWKVQLQDYTTVEHFLRRTDRRPRYTVYVELQTQDHEPMDKGATKTLSAHHMEQLDQRLGHVNQAYGKFRSKGRLERLDVCVVRPGTFRQMRRAMIQDFQVNPSQWKQPRGTRHPQLMAILEQNTIG